MKYLLTILSFLLTQVFFGHQGFEKNLGQVMDIDRSVNTDVLYIFNQEGLHITLRKNGFSYELKNQDSNALTQEILKSNTDIKVASSIERIDFISPQIPSEVISEDAIEGHMKYFTENGAFQPQQFKRILYKDVAHGFDIEFLIVDNTFKYNILKSTSGRLNDFFLEVQTAGDLSLVDDYLRINTKLGQVNEKIPVSYIGVDKRPLKIRFSLEHEKLFFQSEINTDHQQLIIDPVPDVVWSTFIGGSEHDLTTSTAVSEDESIYITGITSSLNNISTSGAFQTDFQGDLDIFISKFSKDGTLIWSSYYGGPQAERIYSIAEDDGFIYLAGCTFSTVGVVTADAHQSSVNGADDIFLLKMDSDGNRIWCTYHGGNDHDFITDMLVENDTIFMVGHTRSVNNMTTSGVHLETYSANEAGHITLFNTDGDFLWGTYFGSGGSNSIQGITRSNNKIVVTGRTNASTGISTPGVHQETFGGFKDAFVATFNTDGILIWGTYFGGDYSDEAHAIGSDSNGGVFISGNTNSLNQIATAGAHQATRLSSEQGFIANFTEAGTLNWATYVGGNATDYVTAMAVNDSTIYIGGQTLSTLEIATPGTFQTSISNDYDGFIQAFDYTGGLKWGTYLGGVGNEDIISISLIANNLIVAGSVNQNDVIFGQGNSYSDHYSGGNSDGFLVYLCQPIQPTLTLVGDSLVTSGTTDIDWYFEGDLIFSNQHAIFPEANGEYTVTSSQSGKCISTSEPFHLSTSGVNEREFSTKNQVSLYPNPTSDKITIAKSGVFYGFIMTVEGKKVNEFNGEERLEIDTKNLNSGTYLVHVYNDTQYTVLKLLKI